MIDSKEVIEYSITRSQLSTVLSIISFLDVNKWYIRCSEMVQFWSHHTRLDKYRYAFSWRFCLVLSTQKLIRHIYISAVIPMFSNITHE